MPDISLFKKIAGMFSVSVEYLDKEPQGRIPSSIQIAESTIPKKESPIAPKATVYGAQHAGRLFIRFIYLHDAESI